MAEYSVFPKTSVIVGEWLSFTLRFADYPSSEYSLTYYFVGVGHNFQIPCTANDDGSFTFEAQVEGDAGTWEYQAVAVDSLGHKFYVDTGVVISEADFASMPSGKDNRSHVKKVLDALEAMIEG